MFSLNHLLNFLIGYRLIRKHQIDLLISFNPIPWASIAWLLAKITRKPMILGLIGGELESDRTNIFIRLWIMYLLKRTDVITVPGTKF